MAYNFFFNSLGSFPSSNSASPPKALVERDLLSLLEEKSYGASGLDVSLSLCPPNYVKKCVTCGEINTPLWRNGPDGPKTLCNACGIRYRKDEKRLNTDLTLAPATPTVQGNNRRNRA